VTAALLQRGWVDEIVLSVYPLMLGRGKRWFPDDADASAFTLVRSKATPSGVLLNTYRHVGTAQS
jgi:dihydrofolate reductase